MSAGGLLLGIDAGGTKIRVIAQSMDGTTVEDRVIVDAGWSTASFAKRAQMAADIAAPWADRVEAIGIGAHGCDSDEECASLETEIRRLMDVRVSVVNDAELLGHAMGSPGAVNVVLGTGSIVVMRNDGEPAAYLGGWGWLIGDDGSAWGLVRRATRELSRSDASDVDPLEPLLLARSGTTTLRDLVDFMHRSPATVWAAWAELVFEASLLGSTAARTAIEAGVIQTVDLVGEVLARSLHKPAVVFGGGVVVHQVAYARRLLLETATRFGVKTLLLDRPPVEGALRLAQDSLGFLDRHS